MTIMNNKYSDRLHNLFFFFVEMACSFSVSTNTRIVRYAFIPFKYLVNIYRNQQYHIAIYHLTIVKRWIHNIYSMHNTHITIGESFVELDGNVRYGYM